MEFETPFQKFLDLIEFDQQIEQQHAAVRTLEREIGVLAEQEKLLIAERQQKEEKLMEAQQEVEAQERVMKLLDEQEKSASARLDRSSNQKEYHSIKAEIETLKKKQFDLENNLLQAWHQFELRKKDSDEALMRITKNIAEIHSARESAQQNAKKINAVIDELTVVRLEKEREVPQEWLEKYILMRARVSDPVVPEAQGSCSACFYKISEQDMLLLRRKKLVQCKDCYRLLYIPEAKNQQ